MEKLTAKEIISRLEEFFGEHQIWCYAQGDYIETENDEWEFDHDISYEENKKKLFKQLALGKIKEIDQYGGEDQGSTWYTVKYFVDHDVYIRTDGYYSSYNGTDFDQGFGREVKPTQKTITVYE